jgi:hypothetical protein
VDWRGRNFTQEANPVAVVDIGSNSIRLVVYEDEIRSPTPVLNESCSADWAAAGRPTAG